MAKITSKVDVKVSKRKVPTVGVQSSEWPQKWYGAVQSKGQITLEQIAEDIEQMCTVTPADIRAVLAAFSDAAISVMKNGDGVSFGSLGTLYPHVSCKTEAEPGNLSVTESLRKLYPHFKAGKAIRGAVHRDKLSFNIFKG